MGMRRTKAADPGTEAKVYSLNVGLTSAGCGSPYGSDAVARAEITVAP